MTQREHLFHAGKRRALDMSFLVKIKKKILQLYHEMYESPIQESIGNG